MPALAGLAIFFFFFFFLDPRIHGSSKIRTDPRRILIDPGFGGFVLPLVQTAILSHTYLCLTLGNKSMRNPSFGRGTTAAEV